LPILFEKVQSNLGISHENVSEENLASKTPLLRVHNYRKASVSTPKS